MVIIIQRQRQRQQQQQQQKKLLQLQHNNNNNANNNNNNQMTTNFNVSSSSSNTVITFSIMNNNNHKKNKNTFILFLIMIIISSTLLLNNNNNNNLKKRQPILIQHHVSAFVVVNTPYHHHHHRRQQQQRQWKQQQRQKQHNVVLHQQVASELLRTTINDDDDDDNNKNNKNTNEFNESNNDTTTERTTTTIKKKKKLPRPERKALERANKSNNNNNNKRRKHNFQQRKFVLQDKRQPWESRYQLHHAYNNKTSSLELSVQSSTPDDIMNAIKRAQNLHDQHDLLAIERFLLEQTNYTYAYGYRGSLLSRLAVAALHMNNHRLAKLAIQERNMHHLDTKLPMEAAALIRGLLRVHNISDAWDILNNELSIPDNININNTSNTNFTYIQDVIKHRAMALSSIISRHFFEGEPVRACAACQILYDMAKIVVIDYKLIDYSTFIPWNRLFRGAIQCQSIIRNNELPHTWENSQLQIGNIKLPYRNVVYAVLDVMTKYNSLLDNNNNNINYDDELYELISNALVRRVVFVTGAINIETCPISDGRGEACFIGRSNVGKSSLINMITNRKCIAYTSKRPGKTQQFNYFAINDKQELEREIRYGDVVEGEPDLDTFYIVDLPGFGYAHSISQEQKQQWITFMNEYIQTRITLCVIFHLIDGRHGPTDDDRIIMKQISNIIPSYVQYVVVLTKADKNIKGSNKKKKNKKNNNNNEQQSYRQQRGKVSNNIINSVRNVMNETNMIHSTPIILSSAETKLGRDEIWKYLRKAAEYKKKVSK